MVGNKENSNQPPVVSYPPPYAYYPPEDEVSLVDLWRILVRRKKILSSVTAVVTLGALLYALLATPEYKVEATFLPATASDIQALNIPGFSSFLQASNEISTLRTLDSITDSTNFYSIDTESVYALFEKNLRSRFLRQAIFENMNLIDRLGDEGGQESSTTEIFEEFNQNLTVTNLKKQSGQKSVQPIRLSMQGEDPVLIAEIVNRLGEEAERATATEIIAGIRAKVGGRKKDLKQKIGLLREIAKKQRLDEIEQLEVAEAMERTLIQDKIASLRNQARTERQDKISRLQEAATIARSLDIVDFITVKSKNSNSASPSIDSQALTNIAKDLLPLYSLGYKVLEAEIVSLSNRTVEDPFIPDIRELQERLKLLENKPKVDLLKKGRNDDPVISSHRDKEYELAWLESIDIDPLTVETIRVDQVAYAAEKRIKPKRKLIAVLGLMLGLMLGVFTAFFVEFNANQKREQIVKDN